MHTHLKYSLLSDQLHWENKCLLFPHSDLAYTISHMQLAWSECGINWLLVLARHMSVHLNAVGLQWLYKLSSRKEVTPRFFVTSRNEIKVTSRWIDELNAIRARIACRPQTDVRLFAVHPGSRTNLKRWSSWLLPRLAANFAGVKITKGSTVQGRTKGII